ncbi:MAG: Rpp14/Pop5 family protein [Desulfurococcales archaeon]|nr:Rpp14/Pop5 family protein [Desulfurococcales archaeon]
MIYLTLLCYGEAVVLIVLIALYLDIYRKLKYGSQTRDTESFLHIRKLKGKPRKRYIVIEAVGGSSEILNNQRRAIKWIEESFRQIIGEIGLVNSGFTLVDYNPSSRRFIVRVYHHKLDILLGALGIHNSRSSTKLAVISVTGSIRKARSLQGK